MTIELPPGVKPELVFTTLGLVLSLFGWLLFRFGTRLASIAFGVAVGFFLGEVANTMLRLEDRAAIFTLIGGMAACGLAAFFAVRAISNFLFAVIGLLFGALAGRMGADFYVAYTGQPFSEPYANAAIILVAGGLGALLSVWLQRLIMIVATSYMGATFLDAGVEAVQSREWAMPALFFAGIIWQGYVLRRIVRDKKPAPSRKRQDEEASR